MAYASKTSVPVDRSKAEVESILDRYGATKFAYGSTGNEATIQFEMNGRIIRFSMSLPQRHEFSSAEKFAQAQRSRWRSLVLVAKAKLESVESEIATFEDEFLAYTVVPGGVTVAEWLQPQIDEAYRSGLAPSMLAIGSVA